MDKLALTSLLCGLTLGGYVALVISQERVSGVGTILLMAGLVPNVYSHLSTANCFVTGAVSKNLGMHEKTYQRWENLFLLFELWSYFQFSVVGIGMAATTSNPTEYNTWTAAGLILIAINCFDTIMLQNSIRRKVLQFKAGWTEITKEALESTVHSVQNPVDLRIANWLKRFDLFYAFSTLACANVLLCCGFVGIMVALQQRSFLISSRIAWVLHLVALLAGPIQSLSTLVLFKRWNPSGASRVAPLQVDPRVDSIHSSIVQSEEGPR